MIKYGHKARQRLRRLLRSDGKLRWDFDVGVQDDRRGLIHGSYVKMNILSAYEFCVCVFGYSEYFIVIDCD